MTQWAGFSVPDLEELYSRPYDDRTNQWRRLGAIDKSQNIVKMTEALSRPLAGVLEVGAGTGDVLRELAATGFAPKLTGIEIGSTRSREEVTRVGKTTIHRHGYDGITIPYEDGSFDLVYATHVLEHVLNERGFLNELRRVSRRYVYIEVPCELGLRTSYRSLQRTLNIGHVNPYSPESFVLTLETSGLVVRRLELFDHSYDIYRFKTPAWKAVIKRAIRRSVLRVSPRLASRFMTYHCGALCEKAEGRGNRTGKSSTLDRASC